MPCLCTGDSVIAADEFDELKGRILKYIDSPDPRCARRVVHAARLVKRQSDGHGRFFNDVCSENEIELLPAFNALYLYVLVGNRSDRPGFE